MGNNKVLFKNGFLVFPDQILKASLAVKDGKIEGILLPGHSLAGYEEIDVAGNFLMPGVIDPHVHMWDPSPMNYREDWASGSRCAPPAELPL